MSVIHLDKNSPSFDLYDICIIGSGPAGLTLCNELINSGKRICVLESGQYKKTSYADALRNVISTGEIIIRTSSRERIFGGTSTTWSGLSSPLDQVDFDRWPISLKDMTTYYDRASSYGFPRFNDFEISTMENIRSSEDFTHHFKTLQEKIFIAGDPPWNFGNKLKHIFENKNIDLILDATVIKLNSEKSDGQISVTSAEVISSDGTIRTITAKQYVVAAGGIESTRLLLASDLGNEYDQVGRYITNHPKGFFGVIELNKKVKKIPHLFGFLRNGRSESVGLRIRDDIQKSQKLLNSYVRFEPMFPWTDNRGVEALILIMKKTKYFLAWWKRRQKKLVNLRDWNETGDTSESMDSMNFISFIFLFPKVLIHAPSVAIYSLYRLFPKKDIAIRRIRLRNFMDMELRRENRLVLTHEKIPEINLNTSELDRASVIELHKRIADELKKNNIGTLESNLSEIKKWPITAEASHHLGGTIMGNDPKYSVVDKNLRVHSVYNLYIASGSVFPSAGCANPTYTICALSIRLADYLSDKI